MVCTVVGAEVLLCVFHVSESNMSVSPQGEVAVIAVVVAGGGGGCLQKTGSHPWCDSCLGEEEQTGSHSG